MRSIQSAGPHVARPRPGRLWPWILLFAIAALAWLLRASRPDAPAPARPAIADAAPPAAPTGPDAAAAGDPVVRQPLPMAAPPQRTFGDYVEQLVALGLETSRLHAADDHDGAKAADGRTRALFGEMMERLPEAEAEALAALIDTGAATDEAAALRRRIWNLALDAGLQRRHAMVGDGDARDGLDSLVAAMLTALPRDEQLAAELGRDQLADKPYLGRAHERTVLELTALSGEGRFPAAVATALLVTLWRNLQAAGLRSSDQLAGLALLMIEGSNSSERTAACRLLLGDARFRHVVLARLRQGKDRELARAVAMAAAQDLPPAQAIEVLAVANAIAPDHHAPFLLLGHRDPAFVQQQYERYLADNTDPQLRGELVTGAGFARSPQGIEVARLAATADPSPDVRVKALFVLTANAGEALGESALTAALDDPAVRDNPRHLASIVLALENLERQGLVNAIDRLGQRLRGCANLPAAAREDLERILARALPGGSTSR